MANIGTQGSASVLVDPIEIAVSEDTVIVYPNTVLKNTLVILNPYFISEVNGLFIELGFGNPLTNTYIDIEDCDTYLNSRFSDWEALTDDVKIENILKGVQYIERHFDFKSIKLSNSQGLSFPRMVDIGNKKIPVELKQACIEASYLSFISGVAPISVVDTNEQNITELKEKVGLLETVTKYSSSSSNFTSGNQAGSPSYEYLKGLLKDLLYTDDSLGNVASSFKVNY